MYRHTTRRRQAKRVTLRHWFEDAGGNEVECLIRGTIHPGQRQIIHADPDDCQEGYPAWFEFEDAEGLTRPLADDEWEALSEDGSLEEMAFEEVENDEPDYCDEKDAWKEEAPEPAYACAEEAWLCPVDRRGD